MEPVATRRDMPLDDIPKDSELGLDERRRACWEAEHGHPALVKAPIDFVVKARAAHAAAHTTVASPIAVGTCAQPRTSQRIAKSPRRRPQIGVHRPCGHQRTVHFAAGANASGAVSAANGSYARGARESWRAP
eukprot:Amastigsp_a183314_5.p2 type:complete len:133 gc:universal Amastigsp_a183314_5:270-668(+)